MQLLPSPPTNCCICCCSYSWRWVLNPIYIPKKIKNFMQKKVAGGWENVVFIQQTSERPFKITHRDSTRHVGGLNKAEQQKPGSTSIGRARPSWEGKYQLLTAGHDWGQSWSEVSDTDSWVEGKPSLAGWWRANEGDVRQSDERINSKQERCWHFTTDIDIIPSRIIYLCLAVASKS